MGSPRTISRIALLISGAPMPVVNFTSQSVKKTALACADVSPRANNSFLKYQSSVSNPFLNSSAVRISIASFSPSATLMPRMSNVSPSRMAAARAPSQ